MPTKTLWKVEYRRGPARTSVTRYQMNVMAEDFDEAVAEFKRITDPWTTGATIDSLTRQHIEVHV